MRADIPACTAAANSTPQCAHNVLVTSLPSALSSQPIPCPSNFLCSHHQSPPIRHPQSTAHMVPLSQEEKHSHNVTLHSDSHMGCAPHTRLAVAGGWDLCCLLKKQKRSSSLAAWAVENGQKGSQNRQPSKSTTTLLQQGKT